VSSLWSQIRRSREVERVKPLVNIQFCPGCANGLKGNNGIASPTISWESETRGTLKFHCRVCEATFKIQELKSK